MRAFPMLFLIAAFVGCDRPIAVQSKLPLQQPVPPEGAGNTPRHTIKGRVTWKGGMPKVPDLPPVFGHLVKFGPPQNAYFPLVDGATKGLANVVVHVKLGTNFKEALSRRDLQLRGRETRLFFGDSESPIAVATVGSEVEMKPGSPKPVLIRARGASFYSLAFPSAETAHTRRFDRPGIVEFTDGTGNCFAHCRAYVFDHPWFAITDGQGRFEIGNVPAGDCELVYEIADYRMDRLERDPDTQVVTSIYFKEPRIKLEKLSLDRNLDMSLEVPDADFR